MAKQKLKDPRTFFCVFLATTCFCAMIALFVIGGIFFSDEHPKVLNYVNSMCRVDSRLYKSYQCTTRYYRYTCYGPAWDVHHGENRTISAVIEGTRRYRSYLDALRKAQEYQIGVPYSCWYDTRNPSIAQWDKPSTVVAIILLCCGGLSVLLTIAFIFLASRFIKQELLQRGQDNMDPYGQSAYIKQ